MLPWKIPQPEKSGFHDLDMLVLAVGMKPPQDTKKLQEMLGLQLQPGRILPGSPSQAPAGGCRHTGNFLRRLCRGAQGYQGIGDPGFRRRRPGHPPDAPGEISLGTRSRRKLIARTCKSCGKCAEVCPYSAISVDAKTQDRCLGQSGSLRRMRDLRRRVPVRVD